MLDSHLKAFLWRQRFKRSFPAMIEHVKIVYNFNDLNIYITFCLNFNDFYCSI